MFETITTTHESPFPGSLDVLPVIAVVLSLFPSLPFPLNFSFVSAYPDRVGLGGLFL
jgi:hypothetical protein